MSSTSRKLIIAPILIALVGLIASIIIVFGMRATQFQEDGFIFTSGPTTGLSSLIMSNGFFMIFLGIVIYNMGFMRRFSIFWLGLFSISMGLWILVVYQLSDFVNELGEMAYAVMLYLLCASVIFLDVYFLYSVTRFAVTIHIVASYLVAGVMVIFFVLRFVGKMDPATIYTVVNYMIPINFIVNGECLYLSYRQTKDHTTLGVMISLYTSIVAIIVDMFLARMSSPFASIISPFACLLFLMYQMYLSFRQINSHLISERMKEEVEKERLQNQMSTLYSQIQPHFIFNALNTIGDLCVSNPEEAENAVIMFSKYLRSNIAFMDGTETVRFLEEMNNVKNYFELEHLRFGDSIHLVTEYKCVNFDVPLLSIQPLVENCIKHGLRPKRGGGTVKIVSFEDDMNNYVTISDDGVGFDVSVLDSKEGSVGTKNVRRRVELYSKGKLEVQSIQGEGSMFKIILPKTINQVDA